MSEKPTPGQRGQKAAATRQRHKDEHRAESLRQIRAQTADGTLVVRQMTAAERKTGSELASEIFALNERKRKRNRVSRRLPPED